MFEMQDFIKFLASKSNNAIKLGEIKHIFVWGAYSAVREIIIS